jgi:hypothetical protein
MPFGRLLCFVSLAISSSSTKPGHMSRGFLSQPFGRITKASCLKSMSEKRSSAQDKPERFIPHRSRSRRTEAPAATTLRAAETERRRRWGRDKGEWVGRGFEKVLEGAGRRSSICGAIDAAGVPIVDACRVGFEGRRGFMSAGDPFSEKGIGSSRVMQAKNFSLSFIV